MLVSMNIGYIGNISKYFNPWLKLVIGSLPVARRVSNFEGVRTHKPCGKIVLSMYKNFSFTSNKELAFFDSVHARFFIQPKIKYYWYLIKISSIFRWILMMSATKISIESSIVKMRLNSKLLLAKSLFGVVFENWF